MKRFAIAMVAAWALTGCGGGGGGGGDDGGPGGPAEAKLLTQEARTIASADDIDQPADLAGDDAEAAEEATSAARECLAGGLGEAVDQLVGCYDAFADPNGDGTNTFDGQTTCTIQSAGSSGPQSATVVVTPATPAGHDTLVATGRIGDVQVALTGVVPRDGSETNNSITVLHATLRGTAESVACGASQVRLTLGEGTTAVGLLVRKIAGPVGDEDDLASDVDEADFNGPVRLEQLGATPAVLTGDMELGVLRCTSDSCAAEEEPLFNPDHILFALTASVPGDSGEILVDWTMTPASARGFNSNAALSSTNFVDGVLRVEAQLALQGVQPYDGVLTIDLNGASNPAVGEDDGLPFGVVSLRLAHGSSFIEFEASNSTTDPSELDELVVRNEEGAEMVITEAPDGDPNVIGIVRVDGTQVGTVEETDDGELLIRYNDGTFESLG